MAGWQGGGCLNEAAAVLVHLFLLPPTCRLPASTQCLPNLVLNAYCPPLLVLQAELDEGVLRKLAATARATLNPMAAMFGGVVGQEVSGSC